MRRNSLFWTVSLALAWVLTSLPNAPAADDTAKAQKGPTIEGITEYTYPNGLRVLLFPDPSTSTVTVNLTVFVGSRQEGYGETGMAHLLEHMLFKGTPAHRDIPKALRDHGANYNGSTWVDRTNYYETMPASEANLEFALNLEADRLVNSLVRREDLVSEMTVVRSEFEMGENSPTHILEQRMLAVAYEWHNYGKSTIGNRSDIERVPIDRLQAFYKKYYRVDNCMLVVAGNFNEAKALGLIDKYFTKLKPSTQRFDATYTEEPTQDGERLVALRRVGSIGAVGVVYHIPAGAHPDYAAIDVLETMLTNVPSGRLYKALVEKKLATSVSGAAFAWHDPGVLRITARIAANQDPQPVRDALLATVESMGKEPAQTEEVERAKTQLIKQRVKLMEQSGQIGIELSEWAAMGDWRLFFLHRDRLKQVTPADVNRVAAHYLLKSNRTVGIFYPTPEPLRAAIPQTPAVEELVRNYVSKENVAIGEAFDPTPENLEKRVKRLQLPEGIKLALLPKKSRGEAVVAQLTLHFGNAESLKNQRSAAGMLAEMMARGTKKHTRQQLHDAFDKLHVEFGAASGSSTNPGQVSFSLSAKRDALLPALRLLQEVLREPTFPAQEFEILRRQHKQSLENGKTDPQMLALTTLRGRLNVFPPGDIRHAPTIEESLADLEKVSLEQIRQLYERQLGGTVGECVIVGDFDPAPVQERIAQLLHGWKASAPYEHLEIKPNLNPSGPRLQDIQVADKPNAIFLAARHFALKDTDPDYAPLEMADYLLGGGEMSSRLGNRIREKEGLSYTVLSQLGASARDNITRFNVIAICNPANMEKVTRSIDEEMKRYFEKGVEKQELEEGKKALLQQFKLSRAEDDFLVAVIAEDLTVNRTFAFHSALEERITKLTQAEVNAVIRKYLDPVKLVIVRAGELKKAKPSK